MPKYLVQGSYSVEGMKGVLAEGGTARVAAVSKLLEAAGGKVEAMYFAFGGDDFVILAEGTDNMSAAALAMAVAATGAARTRTTVLLTPDEIDEAAKQVVSYRPPGQ